VFHALVVTGRRRRRDLAVMRSLGSRPGQASGVIRWQGFVLAGTALLVGVPVGIIGGRLLWRSIADHADVRFVVDAPLVALTLVVGAALIGGSFLLAAGPAWSASHRRPADDLRAE
jgi:ABC-type lipoprotein release transport system permease subunit